MANIKSAKKRISVINRKTAINRRVKNTLKGILKSFETAMAQGDYELAKEKLAAAEKKLMQAAAKGTIHKKAASRKVSRLIPAARDRLYRVSNQYRVLSQWLRLLPRWMPQDPAIDAQKIHEWSPLRH